MKLCEKDEPFPENKNAATIKYDYILGNPPFVGKKEQDKQQKEDASTILAGIKGSGVLDYVTCWYIKATKLIQNTNTQVAFVSTNSITQGEQVGILWNELFHKYKIKIHFAHRTFKWSNEARGIAAVHVVIIGFAAFDSNTKRIYDYENDKSNPREIIARNINPYLINGDDLVISKRSSPISGQLPANYGSMPIDGGILILSDDEKNEFIKEEPEAKPFIKQYTGGYEFLNNEKRWCLWLEKIKPNEIHALTLVAKRLQKVREYRLKSERAATRKLAQTPYLFGEIRQPDTDYILIPKVSSETRKYIPIGICKPTLIASGSCIIIPDANYFSFGLLQSIMHSAWMKYTCGRMKSDYQYSVSIVYNNFPWPQQVPAQKLRGVEEKAKKVLTIREQFSDSSLANLYNPLSMPPSLIKAHDELDKAVDNCYTTKSFTTELSRLEFLFDLYRKYTEPLLVPDKKRKRSI